MKNRKIVRVILAAVLAAVTVFSSTAMHSAASTAGDVDNSGTIDLNDVTLMLKVITQFEGVDIDTSSADVTMDGKLTLADISLLLRHIAGWQ